VTRSKAKFQLFGDPIYLTAHLGWEFSG